MFRHRFRFRFWRLVKRTLNICFRAFRQFELKKWERIKICLVWNGFDFCYDICSVLEKIIRTQNTFGFLNTLKIKKYIYWSEQVTTADGDFCCFFVVQSSRLYFRFDRFGHNEKTHSRTLERNPFSNVCALYSYFYGSNISDENHRVYNKPKHVILFLSY